jgi:hypothetical protein
VAEAMGVVVMMNGGPGTVWGARAAAAHGEFTGSDSQTQDHSRGTGAPTTLA